MGKSKNDAPDIKLTIPVGLTAACIQRTNPSIGVDEANKLAAELHYIVYSYSCLFAARPPDSPGEHASDEADAVLTAGARRWAGGREGRARRLRKAAGSSTASTRWIRPTRYICVG
jgi:hypothetical protein